MSAGALRDPRGAGLLGLSALLHGLALAAALGVTGRPAPPAPATQPVALVWDSQADGAADAADNATAPARPGVPTGVPAPPEPPAPEPPAPEPPALALPAATAAPPPVPPPPVPQAAVALPALGALPPAPPVAPMPLPEPPARAEPRPPVTPAPRPAQPRPVAPPQPAAAPPAVWSPPGRQVPPGDEAGLPQAAGAGVAAGAVVPARPSGGAANPAPDYPRASRARGEEGRVTLLVQVDQQGRVVDASVLGSSGFAALDQAAAGAVRRWRFEPAMQDGQPVFSTTTIGITFRLEGERRW